MPYEDVRVERRRGAVYDNVIRNIPDPSDGLNIEDAAAEANTLYSNRLVDSNEQILRSEYG